MYVDNFVDDGSPISITFDGIPATILNFSFEWQEAYIEIPPGNEPGLVDIVVTIGGQVATLVDGFEYIGPRITWVDPTYGSPSGGDTIFIDVEYFYNYPYPDGSNTTRVFFGETEATNVAVWDGWYPGGDVRISCDSPTGTGVADIRVEIGDEVAIRENAFDYLTGIRVIFPESAYYYWWGPTDIPVYESGCSVYHGDPSGTPCQTSKYVYDTIEDPYSADYIVVGPGSDDYTILWEYDSLDRLEFPAIPPEDIEYYDVSSMAFSISDQNTANPTFSRTEDTTGTHNITNIRYATGRVTVTDNSNPSNTDVAYFIYATDHAVQAPH